MERNRNFYEGTRYVWKLLAIGVTTLVATQAIINIAVVTASIPTTGMALPFFSYRRNRTVSTTGWSGNFA